MAPGEVVIRMEGKVDLGAPDATGGGPDILIRPRRKASAAKRFCHRLFRRRGMPKLRTGRT